MPIAHCLLHLPPTPTTHPPAALKELLGEVAPSRAASAFKDFSKRKAAFAQKVAAFRKSKGGDKKG